MHILSRSHQNLLIMILALMPGMGFAQESDGHDLDRLVREWGYVADRVENARKVLGDSMALQDILDHASGIVERASAGDSSLLTTLPRSDDGRGDIELLASEIPQMDRRIFSATQKRPLEASFVHPWTRHSPSYVPGPEADRSEEITVLRGEHAAAAFVLSASDSAHRCRITVDGLDPEQFGVTLRRHVYLETWYQRAKSGIYDPLPRLLQEDDVWLVDVGAGEAARVHMAIEVGDTAEGARPTITIRSQAGIEETLSLELNVLPAAPPAESAFEHVSFLYPDQEVCANSPDEASKDLGAHHVTMIEFPGMPKAMFRANGELIEADFSRHDRWLDTYAPNVRRMMIFWRRDIELDDGSVLVEHSTAWRRALIELLGAWLKHSADRGYGPERFAALIADETHSDSFDVAPDEHVREVAETMRQVRETIPELKIFQTLTFYASLKDVEVIAPVLDFACVALPWRERLRRVAPPDYNPRKAWRDEIGPYLRQRREASGLTIGSYHVARGKSDDLLAWNYAYPLIALGKGMTGVGHWAYNCGKASTWHDWDGTRKVGLDYLFVYDGTEDHERNRLLNPTGERIVPSIRWEALREGIQVAKLLLALREARDAGETPEALGAEVDALWAELDGLGPESEGLTPEYVAEIAGRTRRAWARHCGGR